jgi:uncharacterized protein (DUF885 family)
MATRRNFLKIGAAAAALLPFPGQAQARGRDALFRNLLDSLADPTDGATLGVAAARSGAARRQAALAAFDPAGLSLEARLDYDGIAEGVGIEAELCGRFAFGVVGAVVSPYAVSPRSGAHLRAGGIVKNGPPEILASLAREIDGETDRLRAEAALGVVPPDFILDATLAKLAAAEAPEQVAIALTKQIAALTALRPRASHDAGAWRLPQGDDYYALALRAGTSLNLAPQAAHDAGLAQVRDLSARAEPLLRKHGLTQGTVGARLHALAQDPRYLYSDDDAGRAKAVAEMNARLARVRAELGKVFTGLSTGAIDVELAGPGLIGYRKAPSYDGKISGAYYVDLRQIRRRPSWSLPTVVHHETLPGHLLQLPLQERAAPPPLRLRYTPNAFFEGWAIYAEQLADEMGLFDGDDLARLGFLQSLLVRAGRLVIDTGIHFKRWSREEAVARFSDIAGDAPDTFENEVDRIVVQPGFTAGPALGYATILQLRALAHAKEDHNLAAFHDGILTHGAMRLSMLEREPLAIKALLPDQHPHLRLRIIRQ